MKEMESKMVLKGLKIKLLPRKPRPEKFHAELARGLSEYNINAIGKSRRRPLCLEVRSKDKTLIGGVYGEVMWNCLYIDRLWVHETARGGGLGSQLLARAEREGKRMGVKLVTLDTWDFQAPKFYRKYGYKLFGRLKDYPKGHSKFWLYKKIR